MIRVDLIAGMLGHMLIGEPAAGLNHKGPAELPGIAFDPGLPAARTKRAPRRPGQQGRKGFGPAPA